LIRIVKVWKSIKTSQEKKLYANIAQKRSQALRKVSPTIKLPAVNEDIRSSFQSNSQNSPVDMKSHISLTQVTIKDFTNPKIMPTPFNFFIFKKKQLTNKHLLFF
jgi:hypothetical protein